MGSDRFIATGVGSLVVLFYWAVDLASASDLAFVKYHLAAAQHLEGVLPPVRRMDFSPLYFEVVTLVERLQGKPELALAATAWLHRLATGLCAGLLYAVLVRRMPRAWAGVGVAGFVLSPHLQVYSRVYEPEILLLLAVLGYVVASDLASKPAALFAGLFAAAATASRPTFLAVFCVLGPLGFALRGLRGRGLAVHSAWFFVPLVLCGVWLGVRAHTLVGDPLAPVMNPGTVLFEGNHPLSRGTSAAYPISVASLIVLDPNIPDEAHNRYRKVARESLGRRVSTADVNTFWANRAWNFIADEPGRAIANATDKLWRSIRDARFHDVGTAERLEAQLPVVPGLFGLAVALAAWGVVHERRSWRRDLSLWVFGLAQLGVMTVFYVSARQQMVLLPTLVCFALLGARGGLEQLLRREAKATVGALVVLVFLGLSFSRDDTVRDMQHQIRGGLEADRIARLVASPEQGESLTAMHAEVSEVLAHAAWIARDNLPGNLDRETRNPYGDAADRLAERSGRDFFDEFDLASLELEAGRLADARERFTVLAESGRLAYRTYNQASDPAWYLGRIAALEGRSDEARRWLERALATTPGDPYVLAELSVIDGRSVHRERLERYYSPLDANLLIGEALLTHGRAAEAASALGRASQSARRSQRAAVGHAAALGRSGEIERAIEVYRASLAVSTTPIRWSDEIVALIREWAGRHHDDLEVQLRAANWLAFHGRFREALTRIESLRTDDERANAIRDSLRRAIEASEAP